MRSTRSLLAFALLAATAPALAAAEEEAEGSRAAESGGEGPGVMLLGGRFLQGQIEEIAGGSLRLEGRDEEIPFYEIQEVRLSSRRPDDPRVDLDQGPLVRFRGGESIVARVIEAQGAAARVRAGGLGEIDVPLEAIAAFRLREANVQDDQLEENMKGPPPAEDTVYVRRNNLLRVPGVFRGLTSDYLYLEYDGSVRRVARQLVQGAVLAPVASRVREADPPAVLTVRGAGQLPAYVVGLERGDSPALTVRLPGAPADKVQRLPLGEITRISLASDRVQFLSALEPRRAEQMPVLGKGFPYRRDLCVSGDPLRLGGRLYRRGLGVHSRSVLEYDLGGRYRAMAAVIGLDDSAAGRGSVTFRVLADGKEIYQKDMEGTGAPEAISLPMDGVQALRLEVDYGSDGLDIGDRADWADARVIR